MNPANKTLQSSTEDVSSASQSGQQGRASSSEHSQSHVDRIPTTTRDTSLVSSIAHEQPSRKGTVRYSSYSSAGSVSIPEQTLDEFERKRRLLESLVHSLRVVHPHQVHSLINFFREERPQDEIQIRLDKSYSHLIERFEHLAPMKQLDTDTGAPADNSAEDLIRKRRYRTGNIGDLLNPPLSVPADPWTTVTDDDDFVSHLMSLWFT